MNNEHGEGDGDGAVGFASNLREPLLQISDKDDYIDPNLAAAADNDEPHSSVLVPHINTVTSNNDITCTIPCCGSKTFRMNHNVFLTLLVVVLSGVSDSLWGGTVFAAYLKQIGGGQNGPIGDVEAVNGLAVLLSALPVGYLADRYGRSKVLIAGGILFAIAIILQAFLIHWIGTEAMAPAKTQLSMIFLAILMGLWGIGDGIVNGPCQALYADSTPAGERTKYYQYLFVGYLLASCIGPILSIILFQTTGDEWDLNSLQIIMYAGLGLGLVSSFLMMFFDDSKALDEDNEDPSPTDHVNVDAHDVSAAGSMTQLPQPDDPESPLLDAERNVDGNGDDCQLARRRWIPYILLLAGTTASIGSGMTVKFFPLYFKEEIGMSPSQVQLIYVVVPIFMAVCSHFSTMIASTFGRVQTSLVLQLSGVSCLMVMAVFHHYLDSHKAILVPIYIVRTALMNAPYPLMESILMDNVPKQERARWKSLEAISSLGWCGSAALGGYLTDRWDYTVTFFITACIQLVGTLILVLLLPLVPRKEDAQLRQTRNGMNVDGE
jgi:MFS family permease